ncbi:uncharacterized protein LOC143905823 [Temnothorax americanus]|uniref:uncharacterized protein LOC143905823 n=1 Tax=Temnothorax americanus TaxID=1964332 RepID=UPI00406948F4
MVVVTVLAARAVAALAVTAAVEDWRSATAFFETRDTKPAPRGFGYTTAWSGRSRRELRTTLVAACLPCLPR